MATARPRPEEAVVPLLDAITTPEVHDSHAVDDGCAVRHNKREMMERNPVLSVSGLTCYLGMGSAKEGESKVQTKLVVALVMCLLFMTAEVVGGVLSGSVAVFADAAHMLSDVLSFAVALGASHLASRVSRKDFTFGYHRVEVVGALASVMLIWMVTGALVWEATERLIKPQPVKGALMSAVAFAGICFNIVLFIVLGGQHLHGHGHDHDHDHDHSHSHDHDRKRVRGGCHCGDKEVLGEVQTEAAGVDAMENGHGGHQAQNSGEGIAGSGQADSTASGRNSSDHQGHGHGHGDSEHGHDDGGHSHSHGGHSHSHGGHSHSHGGHSHSHGGHSHSHGGHSHSHEHGSMNLRGAVLHVLGDLLQSIGVLLAGLLIWWKGEDDPRWLMVDPLCTFLFAVLVVWTTSSLLQDIYNTLMERSPPGISIEEVHQNFSDVPGVDSVHDLHVWSVAPGITMLTAHVDLECHAQQHRVIAQMEQYAEGLGIRHCTIQCCIACPVARAGTANPPLQLPPRT